MSRVAYQSADGRIVLWHGDCRKVMAALADRSVDHVITDPPYSEHVHAKGRKGTRRTSSGWKGGPIDVPRDLGFGALTPELRAAVSDHLGRLVRRWSLVFSDVESCHLWRADLVSVGLEYVRTAFWHKVGGALQFTGDRPAVACEAITLCHPSGRKAWNGGGKAGLYSVPIVLHRAGSVQDGEERIHTTQKPVKLMRQIVADFTDPDDLILDPFAGSGATLVAAQELGRQAIGVELDEANCAAAVERLERIERQGDLFARNAHAR